MYAEPVGQGHYSMYIELEIFASDAVIISYQFCTSDE